MLSVYDYISILFYFAFTASLGLIFKKLCKGSTDYFAGGLRMNWWLLGASSLIANFSAWSFTGASAIAYKFGLIFFAIYIADVLGFVVSLLWFAPRFRRLRLVTAMDAVRLRFGRVNEQVYTWIQVITSFFAGAIWLVGLSIVVSTAFQLPQIPVIVVSGMTILIMTLLGGNWAVVASDFIQSLLLAVFSIVVAILSIRYVGGFESFIEQVPKGHWTMFHPLGSIKYDWLYVVGGLVWGVCARNSVSIGAAKYIAAKDDKHARKSVWIPLIGYMILPLFWFIPPVAAHTIVPDLMAKYSGFTVPAEASYIAVCIQVLPKGLLGLLVAGLFAATMSSMDTTLNKNAGFLVKNFYQPILRKNASDQELLRAGQTGTLLSGMFTIGLAVLVAAYGKVSLFDTYLYMSAYVWTPLTVALFMGIFVRNTPAWSGWSTIVFGIVLSVIQYNIIPMESVGEFLTPLLGETLYDYFVTNKFTFTNIVTAPLSCLFFVWTRRFYKEKEAAPEYVESLREFTRRIETPVDFEKEVGDDNTPQQARLMGLLALTYGAFISLVILVPNPISGRVSIASCAAVMLLVGGGLLLYSKKQTSRE